jgi:hypothetical protein
MGQFADMIERTISERKTALSRKERAARAMAAIGKDAELERKYRWEPVTPAIGQALAMDVYKRIQGLKFKTSDLEVQVGQVADDPERLVVKIF